MGGFSHRGGEGTKMLSWKGLTAIAGLFLVLGAATATFSAVRFAEDLYRVDVTAPEGLSWILWLPRPNQPIAIQAAPGLRTVTSVDTPHGPMVRATGVGNATIFGSAVRVVASLDPWDVRPGTDLALSASEDSTGFWVGRSSDDPAANLSVLGGAYVRVRYLGGTLGCGGGGFQGELREGWTYVARLFSDCAFIVDSVPWLYVVSPAFLAAGLAVLGKGLRRRKGIPSPPTAR